MDKIAVITFMKQVDKWEWVQVDAYAFTDLIDATKHLESLGYTLKKEGRVLRFKNEELKTIAQIQMIELNRSIETTNKEEN